MVLVESTTDAVRSSYIHAMLSGEGVEFVFNDRRDAFDFFVNDVDLAHAKDIISRRDNELFSPISDQTPRYAPSASQLKFLKIFFAAFGAILVLVGVGGLLIDCWFLAEGRSALATTVDHSGRLGGKYDQAIVEYVVDGQPYRLTSIRGTGLWTMGDTEWVRYNPSHPAFAREAVALWADLFCVLLGGAMVEPWRRKVRR